jgi:transposase-like protein
MNSRRQELCERIAEVHAQPPRTWRYGAELKRAIVDYARERLAEGIKQEEIARELGLSASRLGKWIRRARLRMEYGRQPFAPTEVARLRAGGDGAPPLALGSSPAPAAESEPESEPEP